MPSVIRMSNPIGNRDHVGFLRQLGVDTGYVLLGFPLALASFCLLVTGMAAGVGTLVIGVGLLVVSATLLVARACADIERYRIAPVLRRPRIRPAYPGAPPGSGFWKRILTPLAQTQSWLDVVHGIVIFPVATATFCVVVSWWAVALAGVTTIAWDWAIPRGPDNQSLAQLIGLGDSTVARVGFQTAVGVLCLVTLPAVVRGCALLAASVSRLLLVGVAEMRRTITVLTEQKQAAASAEATALRRLERDIHDGPQQRLVRLAMDLSRARQQLDRNPESLPVALDEALGLTQETLDELRALSRGIAPPVLVDRGLPGAVAALAVRCSVPTEVDVDPALGAQQDRVGLQAESAAYFVVAEALTNVAKHSGATHCRVAVARAAEALTVDVVDDGVGGARLDKGHGLAGLDDRVRALGGALTVSSPGGGPTAIEVRLPC